MGKKKSPKPPDYAAAAEAQGQSSIEAIEAQTAANRPDQYTPWGSSEWTQDASGNWVNRLELTPEQQRALDAQTAVQVGRSELAEDLIGRTGQEIQEMPDWDPLSMNEVDTAGDTRQRAEDAIYGRATSRLDPMWEQRAEAMESKLWNQGLRPGDQAYDDAMANMERARTDAYQTAMDASIMGGGQEMSRDFATDLQRRQQGISELLSRRGLSVNEMNALLTGQQVQTPQMPGVTPAGAAQPTPYLGAAGMQYQGALDRYNSQQAGMQGLFSGLTGVATAGAPYFGFSDRRLKTDIERIGTTGSGLPVYLYTIFGRTEVGVMADESPPEAVHRHPSGYLMVDYSRIW